jgi:hypothetical protein
VEGRHLQAAAHRRRRLRPLLRARRGRLRHDPLRRARRGEGRRGAAHGRHARQSGRAGDLRGEVVEGPVPLAADDAGAQRRGAPHAVLHAALRKGVQGCRRRGHVAVRRPRWPADPQRPVRRGGPGAPARARRGRCLRAREPSPRGASPCEAQPEPPARQATSARRPSQLRRRPSPPRRRPSLRPRRPARQTRR